ncbi:MAG: efflux RND transporter permease subunit [Kiritimatiellae bacterium]|nr:efflux RND transporter permease subunit [Kiritimatiellia bacterium]
MSTIRSSIRRPVATWTAVLVVLVLGALAYRRLGLDLMPQVNFPFVTVLTVYPGASAEDIETAVARKIEDAVSAIDGVRHLDSMCMPGLCQTLIEFELHRDVDAAATDVRERIALIRRDLPAAAEEPRVLKFDINARAIATLVLTGARPVDELYDLADQRLRDRFSVVEGVAEVEVLGGARREVHIRADPARLAAKGLTPLDLAQAVAAAHAKLPAGSAPESGGSREAAVTFDAEAGTFAELGELQIGRAPGDRVRVRDVAMVEWGTERPTTAAMRNGRPAVVLRVVKRGEANAVRVVRELRRRYAEVRAELPPGVELEWFRDDGDFIEATVRDAWRNVAQGIALTGGVLVLFLGELRAAMIALLSLPVAIVAAFLAMSWLGYTLNTPTLTAFGISVGILVTNSIVVLESIAARRSGRPERLAEDVERATVAIAMAVAASALTNIAVFLPVAMMRSLSGRFLSPFGGVVTAATLASLAVSFTLTPMLAARLFRREWGVNRVVERALRGWTSAFEALAEAYGRSLERLSHRSGRAVLLIAAVLAGATLWTAPRVTTTFVPQSDLGELAVKLEFSPDLALAETLRRAADAERRLRGVPEVRDALVIAGKVQGILGQVSEGAHLAEILLKLAPRGERTAGIEEVRARCRRVLREVVGCRASVMIPATVGGASKMLEVKISGEDLAGLAEVGLRAARAAEAERMLVDVEHTVRQGRPEVRIRPDRAALLDLGWPAAAVGRVVRGHLEGLPAGTFTQGDRSYPIRVVSTAEAAGGVGRVVRLPAGEGQVVPLTAAARVERGEQAIQITRSDKRRVVRMFADLAPGAGLGTAAESLRQRLEPVVPRGYRLEFTGMWEKMAEAFDEFREATLLAIALTYLLLAAILESWTQPLLILTTVPLAYSGLFVGLWLTRQPLSILGLLGGVMLIGVVVNNAILIMDEVNALRRTRAMAKREAMLRAARDKFRPVVMTTVAAALGMLPMAFGRGAGSELRAAIGTGSFAGLVVSSVLSLYVVPLLYIRGARRSVSPATSAPTANGAEIGVD